MWFFGSWRPRTLPLRRLEVCLLVVSTNDAFIACDDVQEECGIFYHSFLHFLTDRYSTFFLILGQHSRHKLRCNPMHVQLFCQNSLTRSITNSNLCKEIMYGMTTILVNSCPYLFHFWGGCCRAWPTWSIIISSRSSAILETPKTLKSSAMAHARITKSLFQHFKSFASRFTQFHTELDAHPLSTSAIPRISENHRQLMQYTHKDTCNNQTLPRPTTPLGTLTHKIPLQHTLAGNSWTTNDLRVMSIVLGLLDTPSY